MSYCKYCGQEIEWVETLRGKRMPVDPEYIDYGDAEVGDVLVTDDGRVIKVTGLEHDVEGRISHFATCKEYEREKEQDHLVERSYRK